MSTKKYYDKYGSYLKEHKSYLTQANLERDTDFIIESLRLTKKDRCLDLQCAQGRLTIELNMRGFATDGLDNSDFMLGLAEKNAARAHVDAKFIRSNLNNLRLHDEYTKIFLYFPDWDSINLDKLLDGVSRALKRGGLFLCDWDSLYRIWIYLAQNPNAPFKFDPLKMELIKNGEKSGNRYFTFPELKQKFETAGFKIINVYGGWSISDANYGFDSPRLRIVAKKS